MVADLVARGDYGKAVALLKAQLSNRPHAVNIRLQLAEVLHLAGRTQEAVQTLKALASDLARHNLAAQSIAVLKRIQAIDPSQAAEEGLADLLHGAAHGARPDTPPPDLTPADPETPSPAAASGEEPEVVVLEEPGAGAAPADPLAATPLFEGFSRDELTAVIHGLRLVAFEPGDLVVSQGEPGHSLFLVTSGRVKAFVRTGSGRARHVSTLEPGEFFGEISLLKGVPRTATVTAAARADLLELDRATVDGISRRHPNVRRVLQEFCEKRLARTQG
ncbi:MAG TPA: cyclic nucleotide-binding domain-containing protein [Vicinamibacteria bacterium]|nr:cyclic nucleotide-binding domain-containing protein [Vicinamibacteria bacterium]